MVKLLSNAPQRLHHHAYVVKDQEKNRQFFEDVLGIPLTATWCEKHQSPWVNREVAFCHTFYSLADGGALAFFSFADDEVYEKTQAAKPAEIRSFDHIAFKVDEAGYDELVARINAIFRRLHRVAVPNEEIQIGAAQIDPRKHELHRKGKTYPLSFYEVELLRLLWERAGQPVTREEILEKIWGVSGHATTRSVDNFVVKLRKKIEENAAKPRHIVTIYGTGYKLVP